MQFLEQGERVKTCMKQNFVTQENFHPRIVPNMKKAPYAARKLFHAKKVDYPAVTKLQEFVAVALVFELYLIQM